MRKKQFRPPTKQPTVESAPSAKQINWQKWCSIFAIFVLIAICVYRWQWAAITFTCIIALFVLAYILESENGVINAIKAIKKRNKEKKSPITKALNNMKLVQENAISEEEIEKHKRMLRKIYPKYKDSDFQGVWDANRLIDEYVKLAIDYEPFAEDDRAYKRAQQLRLYSVICAFKGELIKRPVVDVLLDFERGLFVFDYNEDTGNQLLQLLIDQELYKFTFNKEFFDGRWKDLFADAFATVMKRRIWIEYTKHSPFPSHASKSGMSIGMSCMNSVSRSELIDVGKKINGVLLLLLGPEYKRSITEIELIKKYDYPTVTDLGVMDLYDY